MNYASLKTLIGRHSQQVDIKRPNLRNNAEYTDVELGMNMLIIPNLQRRRVSPDGEVVILSEFTGYMKPLDKINEGDVIFRENTAAEDRLFITSIFHIHGDGITILDIDSVVK